MLLYQGYPLGLLEKPGFDLLREPRSACDLNEKTGQFYVSFTANRFNSCYCSESVFKYCFVRRHTKQAEAGGMVQNRKVGLPKQSNSTSPPCPASVLEVPL